jgi:hypothetical protein
MTIDDHTSGDHDPVTELALTAALTDLVAGEAPSDELRQRVAGGLAADTALRRRWIPLAAAAAVVAIAVLGAVVGLGPDDDGDTDIATMPSPTTEPEPEVLGSSTERDRDDDRTSTPTTAAERDEAPATTVAALPDEPADPAAGPQPGTAPAAPSSPPTTVSCVRSTDPACGPFRWDPAPTNRPATLTVTLPDGPVRAGTPVSLTIEMSDPDGTVTLDCYTVSLDRPGLSTGTCNAVAFECPDRYGSWPPPEPSPDSATATSEVQFDETGTYTITVDASPADGCDNVDPYRSGARTSLTVEVQPAA